MSNLVLRILAEAERIYAESGIRPTRLRICDFDMRALLKEIGPLCDRVSAKPLAKWVVCTIGALDVHSSLSLIPGEILFEAPPQEKSNSGIFMSNLVKPATIPAPTPPSADTVEAAAVTGAEAERVLGVRMPETEGGLAE